MLPIVPTRASGGGSSPTPQAAARSYLALDVEADPPPRRSTTPKSSGTRDAGLVGSTIRAASLLLLDGEGGVATLTTSEGGEPHVLGAINDTLLAHPDAALLTFNGSRFDLPLIRSRAISHHLFAMAGLRSLAHRKHIDVMWLFPDRPSLATVAALLGLDVDLRGVSRSQKCEIDVAQTMLAFLHAEAFERGEGALLAEGWAMLARGLPARRWPHLTSIFDGIMPS